MAAVPAAGVLIAPYVLTRSRASAAEFHARVVPAPASPEVWLHEPTRPALVLGSTQSDSIVDREACHRLGVDVVRRRSGGGAVLLVPGEVTWIDVIVPAGGSGWGDEIQVPMVWLGERLAEAIESLAGDAAGDGAGTLKVHRGPMVTTPWSRTICFDGVGAGEVTLGADRAIGSKLVGISQRRTRDAARLQCCWYSAYEPSALIGLLQEEHRPPLAALRPVATLPADVASAIPNALVPLL